ncbi:MAG: ion channel [Alphaproteobacteria bacterium]|nr:ion channel [Alphaproteobacteria bacterium]
MIPNVIRRLRGKRRSKWKTRLFAVRAEQTARRSVVYTLAFVALLIAAHTMAMMHFEGFTLANSIWLTLTTITTVGYGDLSAVTTFGRAATILIIYFGGIFVVAKMAGDFFDYRGLRRDAMKDGNWSWSHMKNHIVVIGSKVDSELHLARLIQECERSEATAGREIVLISHSFDHGLPSLLQGFDIKYVKGRGAAPGALEQGTIDKAAIVIILAWQEEDAASDGNAFDVICRIRDVNGSARIVAECVDDNNRQRLEDAGATLAMRPMRAYPEMMIGGLLNPGSTTILENLFTAEGERIVRVDGSLTGSWADLVAQHVRDDVGTPIAYRDARTGKIITAPRGTTEVSADALFLLGG